MSDSNNFVGKGFFNIDILCKKHGDRRFFAVASIVEEKTELRMMDAANATDLILDILRVVSPTCLVEVVEGIKQLDILVPVSCEQLIKGLSQARHLRRTNLLNTRIEDLGLPVRLYTIFNNNGIRYVGDLVQKTPADLRRIKGFGTRSAMVTTSRLNEFGHLTLGMSVNDWSPPGG